MSEITVTYKWTAKEGKGEELRSIYKKVVEEAKANEKGTLRFDVYEVDDSGDVLVFDVFEDAEALGQHLGGTARKYFPQLLEIATPGPFFFFGDVPEEIKQIANSMSMGAIFSTHAFGIK